MKILHLCPSNVATGGTESIHKFVSELNNCDGVNAKILYVGGDLSNPQPKEYAEYEVEYITRFPTDFKGVVIFPEIWANEIVDPKYGNCIRAVNWAGVDVYSWHTPIKKQGLFLRDISAIHLSQSAYATDYLNGLGLESFKINDVLNKDFFEPYKSGDRSDVVLYNGSKAKITTFQQMVQQTCLNEWGIKFKPIKGFSRQEVINLLRTSKLYIDFGVFSGRERLPREAAMCGCCVITGLDGASGFYEDVSIPHTYKFEKDYYAIPQIENRIKYVLQNYNDCVNDFDEYRKSIIKDRDEFHAQCEVVSKVFKERYEVYYYYPSI